ncbi:unnamed protein product [Ectocarpus fasciculatus]
MEYAKYVASAVAVKGYQQMNGVLNLTRSVRDVDNDSNRSFAIPYGISEESIEPLCPPIETLKYDVEACSPSGRAVVRMSSADDKCTVEVLDRGALTLRFDASEDHGKAVGDNWFGGFGFSSDETRLVYVAGECAPVACQLNVYIAPDVPVQAANKYDYKEDWGEKYTGVSELGLYILELATGIVTPVQGPGGEGETVGQPAFTSDGSAVVYTCWPTTPKRLGMIYCYQRPCSLKMARVDREEVHTLTSHLRLARYPVFSPSSGRLVFLGSEEGFDMHNNSVKLFVFDLAKFQKNLAAASDISLLCEESCRTVVDHVRGAGIDIPKTDPVVATVNGYTFPGLFAGGLKPRSFVSDDLILVESQWRSYAVVLCVDITTGDIRVMTFDDTSSSLKLSQPFNTAPTSSSPPSRFAVEDKTNPVISNSWLSACPFSLSLVDASITPSHMAVARSTERGNVTPEPRPQLRSYILHTHLEHASYSTTIESVLLLPAHSSTPPPVLISPHGGPHSAFTTGYVAQYNYLCGDGEFAILMVNYRGSTGFGKELLETLPGRVGTQDVFDVFAATETLPAGPLVDAARLGVMGGSHGGFLTAHCIGQKPSFFKAAVLRNPVTNVLSNSTTSDIGDWCVIEGCGSGTYDFNKFLSPTMEIARQMYDCSPIRYVQNVNTPVLLCLGAKDRRVPQSQGLEYYHALKSQSTLDNDLVQMKVYPEADHAIDKPNSEADQFISMKLWFERFLS